MLSRRDFLRLSCIASISLAAPESFGEILHKFDNEPEVKDSLFFNKDYFRKIKEFDRSFPDDYMATPEEFVLIRSVSAKIRSVMNHVGYVNFNVINYDDLLRSMKQYSSLRRFDQKELDYIEEIFARDAADYGFFGEKVMTSLTDNIRRNDIVRIPRTGHYIYKDAVSTHDKIMKDMKSLTLTSGIRGTVKQLYLFLNKAVQTRGNLSMASRSLAPVGYSFHGIGDFDVGIRGWGADNFTDRFATTKEYASLIEGGYMRIRYDEKNPYGVRFEPWHVKVV
ncbi:M15 family metallopeptidase [Seleniivibrio woodruffii]|uniref:M15 family metallopeptidase n=1 Tax=Seleniivibrio woodruffii TaxID=1078050 RepID=UPI002409A77D|nr:M15 family metallopeptidase [Seleniivibrio woodruffii]